MSDTHYPFRGVAEAAERYAKITTPDQMRPREPRDYESPFQDPSELWATFVRDTYPGRVIIWSSELEARRHAMEHYAEVERVELGKMIGDQG